MTRAFANGVWFIAVASKLSGYHYEDEFDATDECKGCAFRSGPASGCNAAGAAAAAAGMPSCDSRPAENEPGFIYRKVANGGD